MTRTKTVLSMAASCWLYACTSATKDPNIILADTDTTENDTDSDQTIDTATPSDTASDTQDTDPVDTDTVDTAVVDTGESGVSGAFQGDLEIIINTQFGEDSCNGTAEMDIDSDQNLTGDGTCNFGILGSQVPLFIGTVSDDGSVSGTVDLEAFGSPFTLDWTGTWNETQIECDFSASAELDSIGAIDYEIRFLIEAEEEIAVDTGDITYIDYGETGTQSTTTETGSFATSDGCTLDYTLFAPTGDSAETLVVIQHGFARSADNFADWGTHLASWGIPSVVMSLNHSSAFDVNIDQNGADPNNKPITNRHYSSPPINRHRCQHQSLVV